MDDDQLELLLDDLALELDLDFAAPLLEPVLQGIVDQAPRGRLGREAAKAATAIWNEDIAAELRDGFEGLREEATTRLDAIEAALRELERPPRESQVARAVVFRAAVELLARVSRNHERMNELEERLREAPEEEHAALTLPAAVAAIPAAAIDFEEADEAVVGFIESFPDPWEETPRGAEQAAHWLARTLATDERRAAMRSALAELADVAHEEFPLAAGSLEALLAEVMPEDPAEDDLWVNLVVGLAQEHLGEAQF